MFINKSDKEPPLAQFHQYCWVVGLTVVLGIASVLTLNYFVDPYLIHQWDTKVINRLRPPEEKLNPWSKTYAISQYQPQVVYVGSSRVQTGLPTKFSFFKGKRVFNAGITGGSLGDAIDMLVHSSVFNRPDLVIWELDYLMFSLQVGNTDFDRALVAKDKYYPIWRMLLNLKRALSMDMTMDSISLLKGSFGEICRSSLAFGGQRDEACALRNLQNRGGTVKALVSDLKAFSQKSPILGDDVFIKFESVISELCSLGTVFRLYVSPTHSLLTDMLYWTNKWNGMEAWKSTLVKIINRQKQLGCDIRLVDFSGFNSITMEFIPQITGQPFMHYFWEASHYRTNVGAKIIRRLVSNTSDVEDDFGVELTSDNIAAYLDKVRHDRDQYHQKHKTETELVKSWITP